MKKVMAKNEEGRMKKFIKKHWLVIAMILFFLLKLWMVKVQPIYVRRTDHDDFLFVREAKGILEGEWLGTYNDTTLSKGITGILFIVMYYKLGISYLMAQQILYGFACVSMIHALKQVVPKKRVLFICYLILLWNPISYSDAFSFVYRDGLYTILILFLIAFSLDLFFHYKSEVKKLVGYSIAFGITFAAIYLCREETVWLYPYLVIGMMIMIRCIIKDQECKNKGKRITLLLGIPIGILVTYILIICTINYRYYGRFITNDFTSKEFKNVYGALTRVKQENYIKRVPLNEESRRKLYQLSPKFQELEEFLEGRKAEKYKQENKDIFDFQEGFLYWAVRDAAKSVGYYENAKTAEQYYIDLANEINELCDSRKNSKLSETKFFNCTI